MAKAAVEAEARAAEERAVAEERAAAAAAYEDSTSVVSEVVDSIESAEVETEGLSDSSTATESLDLTRSDDALDFTLGQEETLE